MELLKELFDNWLLGVGLLFWTFGASVWIGWCVGVAYNTFKWTTKEKSPKHLKDTST